MVVRSAALCFLPLVVPHLHSLKKLDALHSQMQVYGRVFM